ncbi:hypothetical protein AGOR_G00120600 [Albula goreensis]|uniref:Ig-like domain-containing protein n=1 Tax=Albula goreensis TaxID=1534307 RepID=A0A8T3DHJ9_9TELE|nr:hypothetical protein AGOR_G00120600 [Albula goreensis]
MLLKNTSVSVSPSGVIKEGSSVTLTCSSDANPPVQRHTWFKKTGAGTSERGTGESYTITDLKPSDSGEYYCKEGSSVTLTCSSDANPPVQRYTWFKKTGAVTSERGTGESYTITNISSEDSGQYYCEAQNQHGALSSTAVTIDVQYPPKSTSVSVSPSGEIEEGSSVTLTCSSDANPPVHRYTWFKKTGAVTSERGTGESYTITNISSEDSGQYYCEAQNQHGALNSTAEGSSVTLTCSSDANPPVQRYTWFKKNESGVWQTGSGQSLNFSNFRSWNSGLYYCETENTHGALNSTALLVSKQESAVLAAVGTTAFMALLLTAVILWMRRRKSTKSQTTEADRQLTPGTEELTEMNRNQEEGLYSTVQPTKISSYHYGDTLYSNGEEPHPQAEDEVRYASIRFTCPSAAPSSAVHSGEGESVIYSTINKHKH